MTTTLDTATCDTLDRLGDCEQEVWNAAEIKLYLQDGYDLFTRQTKCIFDQWVIENLPPVGNWQTDLERYLAQQKSGWGLTDEPFHYTNDEQNLGVAGQVGSTYRGPSGLTSPSDRQYASTVDSGDSEVPLLCIGGTLPDSTVEVLRVSYDEEDLVGMSSMQMRQIDVNYETRDGDPQFFVFDKDGINFLRIVPAADGGATYDTIDGSWGTLTYTDDTDVTVVTTEPNGYQTGGYGILVHRTGCFPAMGSWGTPTRIHPADGNTIVDLIRTGRDLINYPFEIPLAYQKYVIYYAMSLAYRREGPGQDIELAEHFLERFQMGVYRLTKKVNQLVPEREGRFRQPNAETTFGIGDPRLPSNYPAAF